MSSKKRDRMTRYVDDVLTPRLDKIEQFCQTQLRKQDDRSRAIHGFIIQEVMGEVKNNLRDVQIFQMAFMEVLSEAGVTIPEFAQKFEAKRSEVEARLINQAEEQMKANMQDEQAKKDAENRENGINNEGDTIGGEGVPSVIQHEAQAGN